MTVQLSDRHGLSFAAIFLEIKSVYLKSAKKKLPQLDETLGFDHYWTFESYDGRVTTLCEVLGDAELSSDPAPSLELSYLIQLNSSE